MAQDQNNAIDGLDRVRVARADEWAGDCRRRQVLDANVDRSGSHDDGGVCRPDAGAGVAVGHIYLTCDATSAVADKDAGVALVETGWAWASGTLRARGAVRAGHAGHAGRALDERGEVPGSGEALHVERGANVGQSRWPERRSSRADANLDHIAGVQRQQP